MWSGRGGWGAEQVLVSTGGEGVWRERVWSLHIRGVEQVWASMGVEGVLSKSDCEGVGSPWGWCQHEVVMGLRGSKWNGDSKWKTQGVWVSTLTS